MAGLFRGFFELLRWSFRWERDPKCKHEYAIVSKWVNRDGVPMADIRCPDCSFSRYAEYPDEDPDTWGIDDDKTIPE